MIMDRYDYMASALRLAQKAKEENEIPVGCVIVHKGEIIAEGYNHTEKYSCATKHAEIIAIEKASKVLSKSNLSDCELYVTLEPCPMCAGAIINSKISRVIFGAYDTNYGACGTALNLFTMDKIHRPECFGGVCEEKCSNILAEFFKNLRDNKKRKL